MVSDLLSGNTCPYFLCSVKFEPAEFSVLLRLQLLFSLFLLLPLSVGKKKKINK